MTTGEPRGLAGRMRQLRLCAFLAATGAVVAAEAYRFYPNHDAVVVPLAADAVRWHPSRWGPGETLEFFLAGDDPGWATAGVSPESVRGLIETALARWAAIPGADIRWRIGGVVSTPGGERDGRNTVTVRDDRCPDARSPGSGGRDPTPHRAGASRSAMWCSPRPLPPTSPAPRDSPP